MTEEKEKKKKMNAKKVMTGKEKMSVKETRK